MGTTSIDLNDHVLLLNNVLYVSNAYKNIISISSMTRKGYKFLFERDVSTIYFNNKIVGMGYVLHGLYYIDNKSNNKQYPTNLNVVNTMLIHNASNLKYLWHLRLGHITDDRITKLKKLGILSHLESSSNPTYEACIQGKMTRSPFVG